MGKSRAKSRNWKNNSNNPSKKKGKVVHLKPRKKREKKRRRKSAGENDPSPFGSGRVSYEEAKPSPEDLQRLLEPYSKRQLMSFLADSAVEDPGLLSYVRSIADLDLAHRNIFVHGLGWDVTREALVEAFSPFGKVEECKVVLDKVTNRPKGYGFVLFSTRAAAVKALKEPQKKIGNRMACCQLASVGPVTSSSNSADIASRRIYVSNVQPDVSREKLKAFFASFGEIETGPIGFDMVTGKSRGFALFVYKTQEGASKALLEPYKMFEGQQLHCQLAFDNSHKEKFRAAHMAPQNLEILNQQPAFAAQNAAMLSQNPAYSMLLVQNPLLTTAASSLGALNPAALAALNPSASFLAPQGPGYGGIGAGMGGSIMFGAYGPRENFGLPYAASQLGQPSSLTPTTSLFGGFPR